LLLILAANQTIMKKIFTAIIATLILSAPAIAQDAKSKAQPKKTASPKTEAVPKKGTKLKKDGTPDMRYKENKAAKKSTAKPNAK
jgi:hypothetical protein